MLEAELNNLSDITLVGGAHKYRKSGKFRHRKFSSIKISTVHIFVACIIDGKVLME